MPKLDELQSWIGRRESTVDRIDARRARQLAASFDLDTLNFREGDPLPPLWHWIFATPDSALRDAGPDGHTARGGFLPPVELPRRMWAGSRIRWTGTLRIGQRLERQSQVVAVTPKQGKTGPLVFVGVEHRWLCAETTLLVEEQDLVYRAIPETDPPLPHPPYAGKVWASNLEESAQRSTAQGLDRIASCTVCPDEVLLFRYSALSFNSHKIHYDRRHCLAVEKYPGLVVHGPLLASMMATLAWFQSGQRDLARFAFRALAPVFDGEIIEVRSRLYSPDDPQPSERSPSPGLHADCSIVRNDGSPAMTAQVVW